MSYLMGIDVGTTSTRAVLIDEKGNLVASEATEYPLHTPQPGWAEQNPEDWWQATINSVRQVIAKAGIRPEEIAGLGLSGQMHGSVFLDANNQVIRPAILWCDQRTAAQCDWITETVGRDAIVRITCNPVLTGFTAPKIIWLRDNEPDNFARVRKVLLPKDYIRFRLTGTFATEVSDASGTSLLDVPNRRWSEELMQALGLPMDWLPEVYESPEVSARISRDGAEATGLAEGTPVVGGGGDQAAGAVGNGIVEPGIVSSTIGTSGVVFAYAEEPFTDPELRTHTFCHAVPGKWHVMGVVLSAGGSLRWLRDALGYTGYEQINKEAAEAPAGCEGLIFLPYLTGERTPYPDPYARGVFFGLSLRHDKRHMIRAVMEGAAYAHRDSFEILDAMGVPISHVRISGGGARSPLWRQIMADVTGREHVTINVDEGPAYGVALLAGVGTGIYPDVPSACHTAIRVEQRILPDEKRHAMYTEFYKQVYRPLYPALKSLYAVNAGIVVKYLE
jgi:xylulokinase